MAGKGHLIRRQVVESKLLTIWQWLFNLSLTAVFVLLLLKWPELLLRLRLAADSSIFQSGWLVLVALTLLLLLTAMVHELGHLLAGYLVRFRFQTLIVGVVRVSRVNGRLQWRLQRSGSLFNGLVASLPVEMDNLARRLLYFALGGPLASLLLSLLALAVVLYLGSDLTRMLTVLWLWECCLFTAIASYFFLLTSLRPGSYHNGMMADGGRIVMLLAQSSQALRWQALVQLNVADLAGKRPSCWDETLLRQALVQADNSHDYLTAVVMNYHHQLDTKQPDQALLFLEEALKLPVAWDTGMRARLALEKAYVMAYHLKDLETAQESLTPIKKSCRETNPLFWRAEAALLLLKGQNELAQQSVTNGLQALQTDAPSGLQLAEREWLKNLRESVSP